jgi:hypothetical protein
MGFYSFLKWMLGYKKIPKTVEVKEDHECKSNEEKADAIKKLQKLARDLKRKKELDLLEEAVRNRDYHGEAELLHDDSGNIEIRELPKPPTDFTDCVKAQPLPTFKEGTMRKHKSGARRRKNRRKNRIQQPR